MPDDRARLCSLMHAHSYAGFCVVPPENESCRIYEGTDFLGSSNKKKFARAKPAREDDTEWRHNKYMSSSISQSNEGQLIDNNAIISAIIISGNFFIQRNNVRTRLTCKRAFPAPRCHVFPDRSVERSYRKFIN